jgi:hypothetical protein
MANQIADFFHSKPREALRVAEHISKFWELRGAAWLFEMPTAAPKTSTSWWWRPRQDDGRRRAADKSLVSTSDTSPQVRAPLGRNSPTKARTKAYIPVRCV